MADLRAAWSSEPGFYDESIRKRLPQEGKRNILVTSALPYVNNVPHLGNIIGCVLSADVFVRYARIKGDQVLYICGTDEYGTATEMKALKEGMTPAEICEKYYHLHKGIYDWFNIEFDNFGRTSTPNQTEITQDIFKKLHANGYTSIDTLDQLHCGTCDKFLADRFVFGICPHCGYDDARGDQCDKCGKLIDAVQLISPKCHICSATPVVKTSKHLFVDLDRLSDKVEAFVEKSATAPNNHWSANATAIARSWIKSGLERRCITRDLKWGTPVPMEGFENKVFYVWFDAPIGYLSITKNLLGDDWVKWWKNPDNVELYHFLGKDNVAFHSVMFPACEIGANDGYTLVNHICATEYLNYEDQKFSKSRGTGVFGDSVSECGIPADVWRFYLIYMRPETNDTAFSWDDFMTKVNTELLSNLGNFIHRSLTFLHSNFDATVPEVEITEVEEKLLAEIDEELGHYSKFLEDVKLRDALTKILSVSRKGNQYMQANKPWVLVKGTPEEKKRAGTIIAMSANISVLLSALLYPYMPAVSKQIRDSVNIPHPLLLPEHPVQFLKAGHKINQPTPLFTRLEADQIAEFKRRFGAASTDPIAAAADTAKPAGKKGGKTDKKPKMTEPTAAPVDGAAAAKAKKDKKAEKKEKRAAAAAAAQSGAATPTAQAPGKPDPAVEAILAEYGKVVEGAGTDGKSAAQANLKIDELYKKLNEAKKNFLEELLPAWETRKVNELDAENEVLDAVVQKLTAQLKTLRKVAGHPVLDDPRVITNPVKEVKLVSQKAANNAAAAAPKPKEAAPAPAAAVDNKKAKKEKKPKAPAAPVVEDVVDIGRLDLRVGRIVDVQRHPDADKLYLEKIDLGEAQPRTVISGLVAHVPIEEMKDRLVVCLCNLKPAKMRGIESQAMVMCASSPEKVEIMAVDPSAKPGDIVLCEPYTHRPDAVLAKKNNPWEIISPDLSVDPEGKAVYKGQPLTINGTFMTATTLRNVPVK
uniref:Methionine--tRNA ligase, cytoplasmic n=1 Tax=Panagrellus redivivus TaxID=6233 RepID=A0A7E4ZX46_PANRE